MITLPMYVSSFLIHLIYPVACKNTTVVCAAYFRITNDWTIFCTQWKPTSTREHHRPVIAPNFLQLVTETPSTKYKRQCISINQTI